MDERLKIVARVLDGEKIAALCREFGISRKTGHKIISQSQPGLCRAGRWNQAGRRPYLACKLHGLRSGILR
jgi:putative transposase